MSMMVPAPAYPGLGRARFAQMVLAGIAIVSAMDAGIVALLLEPMKRELSISDVQIGFANTTVYYISYGLLSTPLGILADRVDRTRLLLGALLLWCGALAVVALSHGLWTLMIGKALMGMANAATLPAALSLYSDLFAPERRASATATYPLGQILGSAAAVLFGGLGSAALARAYAAHSHALLGLTPWRALFLLISLTALLLAPLLMAVREPARMEASVRGHASMRELWAYRGFLAPLFAGLMALTGLSTGIFTWVAPALMRLYGEQPGDFAGWYSAVQLGAGLVGVLAAGRFVEMARRRAGRARMMLPAAVAALVCVPASCMALAPTVTWFALSLTVFTISYAIATAIPVIAINFRVPNELRGVTMGLYVVVSAIGAGVSTPAIARLSGMLGGEAMIGRAMAEIGMPLALMAATCFAIASRAAPESIASTVATPGLHPRSAPGAPQL